MEAFGASLLQAGKAAHARHASADHELFVLGELLVQPMSGSSLHETARRVLGPFRPLSWGIISPLLRREHIAGEDAAIQAHYRVGREVRDTLKRLGATMPEDLPTAESIRGELERQRRARQKIQSQQQKNKDTLF